MGISSLVLRERRGVVLSSSWDRPRRRALPDGLLVRPSQVLIPKTGIKYPSRRVMVVPGISGLRCSGRRTPSSMVERRSDAALPSAVFGLRLSVLAV